MTIALYWWFIPLALVALGVLLARIYGKSRGAYDLGSGMVGLALFLACVTAALGVVIGRLLGSS